jgi:hypothetical protein
MLIHLYRPILMLKQPQELMLDLKSNIASPSFTGKSTFTKADNYGQIELTDTKPVGAGVGGGITLNGVYGAAVKLQHSQTLNQRKVMLLLVITAEIYV